MNSGVMSKDEVKKAEAVLEARKPVSTKENYWDVWHQICNFMLKNNDLSIEELKTAYFKQYPSERK